MSTPMAPEPMTDTQMLREARRRARVDGLDKGISYLNGVLKVCKPGSRSAVKFYRLRKEMQAEFDESIRDGGVPLC